MKKTFLPVALLVVFSIPAPAVAFDMNPLGFLFVGSCYGNDYSSKSQINSAVTLVKKADYVALEITLSNDAKTIKLRNNLLSDAMNLVLEKAAGKFTIIDDYGVVTKDNYDFNSHSGKFSDDLNYSFFVTLPLEKDKTVRSVINELIDFATSLKFNENTNMRIGSTGLGIDNPEACREELMKAVSDDLDRLKKSFGRDARIIIDGLDQRLKISPHGAEEVEIWLNYKYK